MDNGNGWSGGGDGGGGGMTPEDSARLRFMRGNNIYAVNTEAHLNMLLSKNAETGGVLVVDYYAPWCRACQKLLKGMQRVARQDEYGSVSFATVDFENARELCKTKEVMKLPTLEIYRGNQLRQRWSGANKKRLLERLDTEMEAARGGQVPMIASQA